LKTTRIEIVRYRRTLVADNSVPSSEDERLTIDVTPEAFGIDTRPITSAEVIEQPKQALVSQLRDLLRRRR
jgi:hypothetical protein